MPNGEASTERLVHLLQYASPTWHTEETAPESVVKAAQDWLMTSGAVYDPGAGRTGTAHLRHYTARFSIWGEGPPLFLVPGLAGGVELVGPLARALSRHYQVISYQLRGEDDCFALRRSFGLSDLVEDLSELLDWFGLERPPLMGVSFGGVVALELAIRRPGRLRALALQGVGPRFEPGLLQQIAGLVLARYPLPADNPFFNQFFNLFFGGRQRPGPLFEFVTRQCWQTDQGVMAHRFRMVEQVEFPGRSKGVRVPALLMAGDRDLLVSTRGLRALAAGMPAATAVTLPGCGHLAFVTHPERVAAEAGAFLDR
jgi:pimeloyl-ACP methyl ester carboxylesterase